MIIEIACPDGVTPAVESVKGQIEEAGQGFRVRSTSEGFPGLQCRTQDECDNFDCPFHGAIMFTRENGVWAEEDDPEIQLMDNPDEDEDEDEDEDDDPYYDEDEDDDGYEVIEEGGGSVVDEISGTIGGIFGESVGEAVKEEIEGGMERTGRKIVKSVFDKVLGEDKPKKKDDEPDDEDIPITF